MRQLSSRCFRKRLPSHVTVSSKGQDATSLARLPYQRRLYKNSTKKYYALNALNAATKYIGGHLKSPDSNYAFQHELFSQDEREKLMCHPFTVSSFCQKISRNTKGCPETRNKECSPSNSYSKKYNVKSSNDHKI